MKDKIEIGRQNGLITCRALDDGRIYRDYVRKYNKYIYICEECEAIWESLEDIANNIESPLWPIETYLKHLAPIFNDPVSQDEVAKHLVYGDFVHIDELRPFLPDSIEIVEIQL